MKKRADFNFVWLFAIIAGTAILILMIYAAIKTGTVITKFQDTDLAKQLAVFTEPMQAGSADALKGTIKSKREIVIENFCNDYEFGYNEISAMFKRDLNEEFNVLGESIIVKNKYLFTSSSPSKEFYVFSVPIEFAFKVSDVIIIGSEEYCFLEGYENLEGFENTIRIIGEKAKFGLDNCSEDSIKVCFDYGSNCDIVIRGNCDEHICENYYETGVVEKDGERIEYVGNLLYPAIFSTKEIYECNLKRILYRNHLLSSIYLEKEKLMDSRGCSSELTHDLIFLKESSFERNLERLKELYLESKLIKEKEEKQNCRLWS